MSETPLPMRGKDSDKDLVISLQTAIANFDFQTIDQLVKEGVVISSLYLDQGKYHTPIHDLVEAYLAHDFTERHVIHLKFIDILSLFLNNGVDINQGDMKKQTPLHLLASNQGTTPAIKVMLASGSRVNEGDSGQQTPLQKAVIWAGQSEAEALLDGGADPNLMDYSGFSALHSACKKKRNEEMIRALVRCGAVVNYQAGGRGQRGPTPLHVAARAGCLRNVDVLLQLDATPDIPDGSGQTALHVAARLDISGGVTKRLLKARANPNLRDSLLGETPLHKAVKYGLVDNVRWLTRHRADPNVRDDQGETCVHKAATSCTELTIWTCLLKARARLDIRNLLQQTPIDKAHRAKNILAISTMRQYE